MHGVDRDRVLKGSPCVGDRPTFRDGVLRYWRRARAKSSCTPTNDLLNGLDSSLRLTITLGIIGVEVLCRNPHSHEIP